MSHTPGPWTVLLERQPADRMALVATIAGHVAIDCTRSGESFAQDCANARLIAAAPDLLAACKAAAQWLYDNCGDDEPLRQVRQAIARAEGK